MGGRIHCKIIYLVEHQAYQAFRVDSIIPSHQLILQESYQALACLPTAAPSMLPDWHYSNTFDPVLKSRVKSDILQQKRPSTETWACGNRSHQFVICFALITNSQRRWRLNKKFTMTDFGLTLHQTRGMAFERDENVVSQLQKYNSASKSNLRHQFRHQPHSFLPLLNKLSNSKISNRN